MNTHRSKIFSWSLPFCSLTTKSPDPDLFLFIIVNLTICGLHQSCKISNHSLSYYCLSLIFSNPPFLELQLYMLVLFCFFMYLIFSPDFRYLSISVNPNTIQLHDFMHLEGKLFLVRWELLQAASQRPSL